MDLKKYRVNPNYIKREIAGEILLIPTGDMSNMRSHMISLNETSGYLWGLFEEPRSLQEVLERARADYIDEGNVMEAQIEGFVAEHVRIGLLQEVEGSEDDVD